MQNPLLGRFIDEVTRFADKDVDQAALARVAGAELTAVLGERPDAGLLDAGLPETALPNTALPDTALLNPEHCLPDACRYRQHVLHVDPAGRFSVVSLVWLPGQATPIHSHVAWCVTGVVLGQELEQRFDVIAGPDGPALRRAEATVNQPGAVSVLVPPDMDVHQVSCASSELTVSIHVYGANIAELGSSINVVYDMDRIVA